jgi:anti-anti-sigma factor
MSDLADVDLVERGNVWLAVLTGEIDLSNADAIGDSIDTVFRRSGSALVLDLTAVDYLDSAGVRLLFQVARASETSGWRLLVAIPDESNVRRILDLADVGEVVPLRSDVAAAEAELGVARGSESDVV